MNAWKRKDYLIWMIVVMLVAAYSRQTVTRNLEWRNSRALWEAAYRVCPRSFKVLNNLANSRVEEKRYSEALILVNAAIMIDPLEFVPHVLRGIVYRELGQFPEAITSHREASRLQPNNAAVISEYLETLERAEHFEEAERVRLYLKDLLEKESDTSGWLYMNANAMRTAKSKVLNSGNGMEASNLDYTLSYPEQYYIREGLSLSEKGNLFAANNVLLEGLRHHPQSFVLLNNIAALHVQVEQWEKAAEFYRQAIERFREGEKLHRFLPGRAYNGLAVCLLHLGNSQEAVRL